MMKTSIWGGAGVAIIILLGAAAYAEEPVPPGQTSDADEMKKKRLKAVEAKKAADEEKQRKQEKQAKVDKIQRHTGRAPTSWQVLNR
jgi:hypothetical protein